jgi:hypothetical protein
MGGEDARVFVGVVVKYDTLVGRLLEEILGEDKGRSEATKEGGERIESHHTDLYDIITLFFRRFVPPSPNPFCRFHSPLAVEGNLGLGETPSPGLRDGEDRCPPPTDNECVGEGENVEEEEDDFKVCFLVFMAFTVTATAPVLTYAFLKYLPYCTFVCILIAVSLGGYKKHIECGGRGWKEGAGETVGIAGVVCCVAYGVSWGTLWVGRTRG